MEIPPNTNSNGCYIILVDMFNKMKRLDYTLHVYSNNNFTLEEINEPYTSTHEVSELGEGAIYQRMLNYSSIIIMVQVKSALFISFQWKPRTAVPRVVIKRHHWVRKTLTLIYPIFCFHLT